MFGIRATLTTLPCWYKIGLVSDSSESGNRVRFPDEPVAVFGKSKNPGFRPLRKLEKPLGNREGGFCAISQNTWPLKAASQVAEADLLQRRHRKN